MWQDNWWICKKIQMGICTAYEKWYHTIWTTGQQNAVLVTLMAICQPSICLHITESTEGECWKNK